MSARALPSLPHSPAPVADRLIVALDVPDLAQARALVGLLRPAVSWFKVGSELFTAAGPAAVALVHEHGARVFLDLKFHDIPTTVAGAVAAAARMGVAMVNVHTAGGEAMLRAAAGANRPSGAGMWAPGWSHPILIGVTLLTSDAPEPGSDRRAVEAALLAQQAGLDGVVTSPQEVRAIKQICGSAFVAVTPGIRPAPVRGDDQRRTATAGAAIRAGADFLVVGRPITRAPDPLAAARRITEDLVVPS